MLFNQELASLNGCPLNVLNWGYKPLNLILLGDNFSRFALSRHQHR